MKFFKIFIVWFALISNVLCFDDPPNFGPRVNKGEVENDNIDEASGLAASYSNPGILWTHNDSGGENRIFAIDTNGINRATYYLKGADNRDWEDICIGPGPLDGVSYIYVGDIGDNDATHKKKYVYRVVEPIVLANQVDIIDTIQNVSVITFTYPDGKRDAETLMIDPITKEIFIIGKRDSKVRLYKLPNPQSTSNIFESELVAELNFPNDPEQNTPDNYLTSGDISNSGEEILVKSYSNVYYWRRNLSNSIEQTMLTEPLILPYTTEPQGESICWSNTSENGYYTLSEEKISISGIVFTFPAQLYYYPRITLVNVEQKKNFIEFKLNQNFPNPFNPITKIQYSIPAGSLSSVELQKQKDFSSQAPRNDNVNVTLKVFDILGKEISTLVNEPKTSGNYEVVFDGSNLSSGIYYYLLLYGDFVMSKKMILIK